MDEKAVKGSLQRFPDDLGAIGEIIQEFDPEIKAELEVIDEIADEESDFTEVEPHEKYAKYSIDEKVKALLYLEIYQQTINERVVPKFTGVGRMLDIDEAVLRQWWAKRKDINLVGCHFVDKVDGYLKLMMTGVIIKVMKNLMERDYPKEKLKDLNITLSTIFNKLRLLKGTSTKNVAHHHRIELGGTVPEE